ncbi:MAG: hypothetical protein ABI693_03025 [Bryobacteraceae bacterium]
MRIVLLAALSVFSLAAAEPESVLTTLASALSERDPGAFIKPFQPDMPGLDSLRANIEALTVQSDVISSIDPLNRREEGSETIIEVDWALTLQSRADAAGGPTERRRQTITLKLRRQGNSWQITSLSPLTFFDPPRF